jgi:glutamate dehydrogenase/leucine dehydrogenase
MRFCQNFMMELSRYIGSDTDVPAGDIGGFIKVADAMVDQGIAQTTSKRIYAALYCALFCLI